ncbi:MAG: glycosyltransferase family 9 protein [Gammaproteobacteria bacterium]
MAAGSEFHFLRSQQFNATEIRQLRQRFEASHQIPAGQRLILIHPGSGGSANNLSPTQYAELAQKLHVAGRTHFVITAGPGERETAQQVAELLGHIPHTLYVSEQGLLNFAKYLQFADLFISGSTGTLHIAGALDTPTAAFYTRRRSATALRWQTLNSDAHRLAFSPPADAGAEDMTRIDLDACAAAIREKYYLAE